MHMSGPSFRLGNAALWTRWSGPALPIVVVALLLCLGVANIVTRANFDEVEDGVLWVQGPEGVIASDIAHGTPAATVGLSRGDVLLAIDGRTPENPGHAFRILDSYQPGEQVKLGVLRQRKRLNLEATIPARPEAGEGFRHPLPPSPAPTAPPAPADAGPA
jgi:predicted metalloprotease with PDZ domain